MRDTNPTGAPNAGLPVLVAFFTVFSCDGENMRKETMDSSSAISSQLPPTASADPPRAIAAPSAIPTARKGTNELYRASTDAIEDALRNIGWTPVGSSDQQIKGVRCTTVLASRAEKNAEVRLFAGYPYLIEDMLELKGTAQGFAEMAMFTVIVKGDAAETDQLFEQLMRSTPARHGTGRGLDYNNKRK